MRDDARGHSGDVDVEDSVGGDDGDGTTRALRVGGLFGVGRRDGETAARPERATGKFPREPLGGVGGERAGDHGGRAAVEASESTLGDETADEGERWEVARTAGTFALVDGFGVVERNDGEPGDDAGGAAARSRGEGFVK